jgi:hypothetical protein
MQPANGDAQTQKKPKKPWTSPRPFLSKTGTILFVDLMVVCLLILCFGLFVPWGVALFELSPGWNEVRKIGTYVCSRHPADPDYSSIKVVSDWEYYFDWRETGGVKLILWLKNPDEFEMGRGPAAARGAWFPWESDHLLLFASRRPVDLPPGSWPGEGVHRY